VLGMLGWLASTGAPQAATLEGRVMEKGTKAFLSGASLLLESTNGKTTLIADADPKGAFHFLEVPAGEYLLTAAQPGFEKVARKLMIPFPGGVKLYLSRSGFVLPEVVVTARRVPKTAVSRQVVTKEELTRVPGTAGDPLRALQALPGVASAGDYSGQLVVRGGGPSDNVYYLDRIPMMFPFHFGGLISTVNPDLIKDVDLSVGGFNAEYGNIWGGVVDITQRNVRRDRWGGRANVNMIMTDLLFEGPLSSKVGLALAGRRSYLELLKGFFDDFTSTPSFGDYQVKLDVQPTEKLSMNFQSFGSDDLLGLEIKADSDEAKKDPALAGEFSYHNIYHNQGANLKWLWSDRDTLLVTPYHCKTITKTNMGREYFIDVTTDSFGLRGDWIHRFGGSVEWRTGVDIEQQSANLKAFFARLPEAYDASYTYTAAEKVNAVFKADYWFFGGFTEAVFTVTRGFQVSTGLRYDQFTYNDHHDVSPRFSAALDLDERTCLKASWGTYCQLPGAQQLEPHFGNKHLENLRAKATVVGLERVLGGGKAFRVEAYDTNQDRIPVPNDLLNYTNDGVGMARGVEFMARQAPTSRLFGWLAYSYSQSKRRNGEGRNWYPYEYDQRHIGTLVMSYKLNRKWETGFKFRFTTGAPETPIVGAVYDSVHNYWVPISGAVNSERKDAYHRLDLSVSRTSNHDTWQLRWYLEIMNVYNSKNVTGYDYSADYTSRKEIKQLPFLPYAGVEVRF